MKERWALFLHELWPHYHRLHQVSSVLCCGGKRWSREHSTEGRTPPKGRCRRQRTWALSFVSGRSLCSYQNNDGRKAERVVLLALLDYKFLFYVLKLTVSIICGNFAQGPWTGIPWSIIHPQQVSWGCCCIFKQLQTEIHWENHTSPFRIKLMFLENMHHHAAHSKLLLFTCKLTLNWLACRGKLQIHGKETPPGVRQGLAGNRCFFFLIFKVRLQFFCICVLVKSCSVFVVAPPLFCFIELH